LADGSRDLKTLYDVPAVFTHLQGDMIGFTHTSSQNGIGCL
jgi:hypothetical protein